MSHFPFFIYISNLCFRRSHTLHSAHMPHSHSSSPSHGCHVWQVERVSLEASVIAANEDPEVHGNHCLLEKSRFSHLWRPPSLCVFPHVSGWIHLWRPPSLCVFPHVSGWILCFTGTRDHCLLPSLRRTHRRLPARRDLCGEGRGGSEPPLPVRHVPQHPAALGVWWPQVHTPMHAARMPEDPRALWSVRHFAPSRLTAPREERRRVQSFGGKKRAVSPMCAARIHSVFFPSVSGWILFARRWSVDLSRRCSQMTAPPSSPLTSQVRASFA